MSPPRPVAKCLRASWLCPFSDPRDPSSHLPPPRPGSHHSYTMAVTLPCALPRPWPPSRPGRHPSAGERAFSPRSSWGVLPRSGLPALGERSAPIPTCLHTQLRRVFRSLCPGQREAGIVRPVLTLFRCSWHIHTVAHGRPCLALQAWPPAAHPSPCCLVQPQLGSQQEGLFPRKQHSRSHGAWFPSPIHHSQIPQLASCPLQSLRLSKPWSPGSCCAWRGCHSSGSHLNREPFTWLPSPRRWPRACLKLCYTRALCVSGSRPANGVWPGPQGPWWAAGPFLS